MQRSTIYIGNGFENIDFDNMPEQKLKVKGFTEGVGRRFADKSKFNVDNEIGNFQKVCEVCNINLAVIYKYEFEDKIITSFFHKPNNI